jgi:hypothetical protein
MKRSLINTFALFVLFVLTNCTSSVTMQAGPEKPRTIVTTDGEVDDMDTFIRLLLYTNEFDIEGIIYTSSQWHYAGDGKGTKCISEMPMTKRMYGERTDLRWTGTEWIQKLIDKYAVSYPNLQKHDPGYPSPEYLKSIIRVGNIDFEGEMSKDTEGSDFIKKILLDNEPGPVYVQLWGGTNTLARALKSIEEEYKNSDSWQELYKKISEKAVIYAVLDQDATYTKYVAPNWPNIRVIYNSAQFWSFAYAWPRVVPEPLKPYLSGPWFGENIKFNHGPLLENYYTWGDGQIIPGDPEYTQGNMEEANKQQRALYDFISEGDSPAYFFMLNYGLRSMEDPSFGGLGGRFVQSPTNPRRWEDGRTVTDFNPYTGKDESSYPQIRWIEDLQNDFAARADWCVKEYKDANHAPVVKANHPMDLSAKTGEKVILGATATDPDGNQLKYSWWQYMEAGSFAFAITLTGADSKEASFTVPADAESGKTIHIILEVSDNGIPVLTRYQHFVVTVK